MEVVTDGGHSGTLRETVRFPVTRSVTARPVTFPGIRFSLSVLTTLLTGATSPA